MTDASILDVRLHGRSIGTLTHIQGDRTLFSFADDYVEDRNRPTLGMTFKDEFGGLITEWPVTQKCVMPYFSNLLPEGQLREYLAARAGVNREREFFLLWALGTDLPGALTVMPGDGERLPPLAETEQREEERKDRILRFSLAGVQLKFSAIQDPKVNKGLTIPANGAGGSWIVKLPSARFWGVSENEFAMLTIAGRVGIDVPEINLVDVDAIGNLPEDVGDLKGKAFVIARFDRTSDGPIHTEDFAQVFNVYPEDKYAKASYRNIMRVLAAETGEAGVAEYIRRLVFSTLIGNADMHLKNWSLIYPDRRTPKLSPAYDFVSTIAYIADDNAALKFSRTNRFDRMTVDELSHLAAKAGLSTKPVLQTAYETVERFLEVWESEKAHLPQDRRVTEKIDDHLERLPIVNAFRYQKGWGK